MNKLYAVLAVLFIGIILILINSFSQRTPANLDSNLAEEDIQAEDSITRPLRDLSTNAMAGINRRNIDEPGEYSQQHLSVFTVLTEIAKRIAEVQIAEAENETNALSDEINNWTDAEKIDFLEFFVGYMNDGNPFNPEAILAFDQVWNNLSLDAELRLASAAILASHYVKFYEFDFAIAQFELLLDSGVEFSPIQLDDYSRALFQMRDYENAINAMLLHIDLQAEAQQPVSRVIHSRLFEAYFRSGDALQAEQVGRIILDNFQDIQDWKDMEQFYLATDNNEGLEAHLTRARAIGLINAAGDWVN